MSLSFRLRSPLVFVRNHNKILCSTEKLKKKTYEQHDWLYLYKCFKVESMSDIEWTQREKIIEITLGHLKIWLSKGFIIFLATLIKCTDRVW